MTTSTINALSTEQTTLLTDDNFVIQTAAGITKRIKATNVKLVGYDDYEFVYNTSVNASAPVLKTFQGGLKASAFIGTGSTDENLYAVIPIRHDIASTTFSFHIQWSHITASPTGDVCWQIEYSIAKSFGVEAFPASTTIQLIQTAGTQYFHHNIEGSNITSSSIEPDSVIFVRLFRNASHASDTFANDAFLLRASVHVSVDSRASTGKTRPFTKV